MNPGKCSEAIRAFVQAHPGCTRDQAKAAVGYSTAQFGQAFRTMRRRKLLLVTEGVLSLGRPPAGPVKLPPEVRKERRLASSRNAKRARRLERGIVPRELHPKQPRKPRVSMRTPRPPKPPKAKPMPTPKLHPIQAANEAAWAVAKEKKREATPTFRVETVEEAMARGLRVIVLPPTHYVAPNAMPVRQVWRGQGSGG